MQLILQTQLLPNQEQAAKLLATMTAFNTAADWLAGQAFELKIANKIKLQQLYYYELRRLFGLSAQMAIRCLAQVCEAYSRDPSIRPHFREQAAIPYDQRMMGFKGPDQVSLLTLEGRLLVPLVMGQHQRERFCENHGQCDLVYRQKDGKWFLLVTIEVAENEPLAVTQFLGVDFGMVNLAADSDGQIHTSTETEKVRRNYSKVRRSLQRKAARHKRKGRRPTNLRRKLKALAKKERAFKAMTNHQIAKQIVEKATDTARGIGLEELNGIRERARFRKSQRERASKWSFAELRGFIEYKAKLAGVPVVVVDPRNTSRKCPECGHLDKGNRLERAIFLCRECGHFDHADIVGAINIAAAAKVAWREVAESQSVANQQTAPVQRQAPSITRSV
jgi:putative transposase